MKLFAHTLLLLLSTLPALSTAAPALVQDWSMEASQAQRKHQPIMLLFTSRDCHYCDRLEQEVLLPLRNEGTLPARVHLRQFNIDRGGKLVDFDGEKIRARLFLSRYHVYATPTVVLLDHQGRPLAEPIVGYNGVARYLPILQQAIDRATAYPHLEASVRPPAHR
ncbi:MAG: thioredoxin fold domain-containing protein [Sedimenticola sp.]|nr:thioredoxin fold domain-containing protein [Sedimenticola sp.]